MTPKLTAEDEKMLDELAAMDEENINERVDTFRQLLEHIYPDTSSISDEEMADVVRQINRMFAASIMASSKVFNKSIEEITSGVDIALENGKIESSNDVVLNVFKTFVDSTEYTTLSIIRDKLAADAEKKKQQAADETPDQQVLSVTAKKPQGLGFSLTKYHSDIFAKLLMESADKNGVPGQLAFSNISLAAESNKDKKERTIFYSIEFKSLELSAKVSKVLDDFDRRVYEAVSTLFECNNDVITVSQIYREMGYEGSPSKDHTTKIIASMDKMASAWITLDQSQDYQKYTSTALGKIGIKYNGQLLYFETVEATINGKYAEKAYHIIKEPVLLRLAKDRDQITTIPRQVLITGKKKTSTSIALENYLYGRIARMKNGKSKSSNKIRYDSIYDYLNISNADRKKKSRTKTLLYELLDHYKAVSWIRAYKEYTNTKGESGVEITF